MYGINYKQTESPVSTPKIRLFHCYCRLTFAYNDADNDRYTKYQSVPPPRHIFISLHHLDVNVQAHLFIILSLFLVFAPHPEFLFEIGCIIETNVGDRCSECYERQRKHHGVIWRHVHWTIFIVGCFIEESVADDSRVIIDVTIFIKQFGSQDRVTAQRSVVKVAC